MFTKKVLLTGERGFLFLKILCALIFGTLALVQKKEADCLFSCSHVFDPVCGKFTFEDQDSEVKAFHNLCKMLRIQCKLALSSNTVLTQISDESCGIRKNIIINGRRGSDFSIVGAHQACNHTCPTHCTDVYEPACAAIEMPKTRAIKQRVMLNHCHVDLLSCSLGLNVTLLGINNCYLNPSNLMFMTQVAGMKSLGLLDETGEFKQLLEEKNNRKMRKRKAKMQSRRNFHVENKNPSTQIYALQGLIELTRTLPVETVKSVIEV